MRVQHYTITNYYQISTTILESLQDLIITRARKVRTKTAYYIRDTYVRYPNRQNTPRQSYCIDCVCNLVLDHTQEIIEANNYNLSSSELSCLGCRARLEYELTTLGRENMFNIVTKSFNIDCDEDCYRMSKLINATPPADLNTIRVITSILSPDLPIDLVMPI